MIHTTLDKTEAEVVRAALEAYAANLYSDKANATRALDFVKTNGGTPAEIDEKERALNRVNVHMSKAHDLMPKFDA